MNSKILIRISLNTLLGVVLIYFWFKLVDVKAVIDTLKLLNFWILPLPIICFLLSSFLRASRIKILLSNYKIPALNLWFLTMLGQLLSFTIPIRAGELSKGVYLSTQYDIPFPKALVWIFLDRFLDFWFTLVIALILVLFIPTGLPENFKPILLLTVAGISSVTLFILIFPNLTKKIFQFISKLLIFPILKKYFNKFSDFIIESFIFLKRGPKQSFLIALFTILALVIEALSWYIPLLALNSQGSLNFLKIQLGSALSSLTYLIPAAPGYVGSAEASGLVVFSYGLGLDKTLVSAATVLIHALTLIYILLFGLLSLYLLKFNLNLLWKKFKKD